MNIQPDGVLTALTAMASAVGIAVAMSQLTTTTRLRRTTAYWREQSNGSAWAYDRRMAQSFYRTATARLVAVEAVPTRELVLSALIVVGALGGTVLSSSRVEEGVREAVPLGVLMQRNPGVSAGCLFLLVFVLYGISRGADAVYERQRIAGEYLAEHHLSRCSIRASGGGQTWKALGLHGIAIRLSIALGLWCWALVYGYAIALSRQTMTEWPLWFSTLLLTGFTCLISGAVLCQALPDSTHWEHPTPRGSIGRKPWNQERKNQG